MDTPTIRRPQVRVKARLRHPSGRTVATTRASTDDHTIPRRRAGGSRSTTPTSPLDIPTDILIVIAQYVEYHTMLSLLAARPSPQFVRGLYDHHSDFWCQRLGAQTGYGCLVREDETGKRATNAPWTPKMQHDALTQRSGYLVLSFNDPPHDQFTLTTNRRIKALVNWSLRLEEYRSGYALAIVALWEDGTIRILSVATKTTVRNLIAIIEDDSRWILTVASDYVPYSRPLPVEADGVSTSPLPKMRTMVRYDMGVGILALDYDGILWRLSPDSIPNGRNIKRVTMTRVSTIASIGRIMHIGTIQINTPYIMSREFKSIPMVTTEGGDRYILRIPEVGAQLPGEHRARIAIPTYVALVQEIVYQGDEIQYDSDAIATIVGTYRPTYSHDWGRDSDLLYPRVPYMILTPHNVDTMLKHLPDGRTIDRSAMGPLQCDVPPPGGNIYLGALSTICYVASPVVVTDGLSGPTKVGVSEGEVWDIESEGGAKLIPLAPKWILGLTQTYRTLHGRGGGEKTIAEAIEHYAQTPFIGYVSPEVGIDERVAMMLRPDGSVDIVIDKYKSEIAVEDHKIDNLFARTTQRIVINHGVPREYGIIRVDLGRAIGQNKIVAMVHIGGALGGAGTLYGVGV